MLLPYDPSFFVLLSVYLFISVRQVSSVNLLLELFCIPLKESPMMRVSTLAIALLAHLAFFTTAAPLPETSPNENAVLERRLFYCSNYPSHVPGRYVPFPIPFPTPTTTP